MEFDDIQPVESRMEGEEGPAVAQRLEDIDVPHRLFDAFAFLSIFKTISDFVTLIAFFDNDFAAGAGTTLVGLGIAIFLRLIANNFMRADLLPSGITLKPWSFKAILNTLFGTRFGFQGHYERLKTEFAKETVVEAEHVGEENRQVAVPPSPNLYGGSETLKVGPRTLTALAEVIQQGMVFYPLLITFLEFGFSGGNINLSEILFISGMLNFAHMLCWLVSPLLNVSYGYVYFTTWLSFSSPFLFTLLFSVVFEEIVTDSYYTRKEIYGWLRTGATFFFGIVGLSVYNSNIHKMLQSTNYRISGRPAILYFMLFISAAMAAFDLVAMLIVLSDEKLFVFADDQLDTTNISRLKSIIAANLATSLWTVVVAYVENISVLTEMKTSNKFILNLFFCKHSTSMTSFWLETTFPRFNKTKGSEKINEIT